MSDGETVIGLVIIAFIMFSGCGEYDSNIINPHEGNTYEVGADGEYIELINNPNATDTTYKEVIKFIRSDKTDKIIYDENTFVCADFAEMVHNNAEECGIRSGWVGIDFEYGDSHACNAFNTTDRGIIFIDCTNGGYKDNWDTTVKINYGNEYKPKGISSSDYYYPMGTVKDYKIYW